MPVPQNFTQLHFQTLLSYPLLVAPKIAKFRGFLVCNRRDAAQDLFQCCLKLGFFPDGADAGIFQNYLQLLTGDGIRPQAHDR